MGMEIQIHKAFLLDTVPPHTFDKVALQELNGILIQHLSGKKTFYFEYLAQPNHVLEAISNSSFSVYAPLADLACREEVDQHQDFVKKNLTKKEKDALSFFNIAKPNYHYFSCNKFPLLHTVIFAENSERIFHKIEVLG